jgi:hypothetical protein
MQDYEKVHLWIGATHKPEDEYMEYFELDNSTEGDFDDPNYKVCQFCKDIGEVWYDEDFIGIIPRLEKEVDLDEILVEAAVDEKELDKIKEICAGYGIKKANAIFWYADGDLVVPKPYKEEYNGPKYIGVFDGD